MHISTVSRELRRNSHKRGYSAQHAQMLADRKTDYIFLGPLPLGQKAQPIARAVNSRLAFLKRRGQLHSITTDNGPEFSAFRSIERGLGGPVYFARPYRSTDRDHCTAYPRCTEL